MKSRYELFKLTRSEVCFQAHSSAAHLLLLLPGLLTGREKTDRKVGSSSRSIPMRTYLCVVSPRFPENYHIGVQSQTWGVERTTGVE